MKNSMIKFLTVVIASAPLLSSCAFIPYDLRKQYLQYDHIKYDGVDYYYLRTDADVPDEYSLFGDKVQVQIVDKNGKPYDKDKYEDAYLYIGDEDAVFIYFGSAPFTRDRSLALETDGPDE